MANEYGVVGSPNDNVAHPDGLECYGRIPEINSKGDIIPAGNIYLRKGRDTGPNKGFGVRHIWAEHSKEMERFGYFTVDEVPNFVRDIIRPGALIYCSFDSPAGRHRPAILKTTVGLAILEPREDDKSESGYIYVVVTAYTKNRADGDMIGRVI